MFEGILEELREDLRENRASSMILSVLSFLGVVQTFRKSKCKKLLDTTMQRINILQERHEVQLRHTSQSLAHLLILGKNHSTQIWLERLWKELCLLSVYNKVQEYCDRVKINLSTIASERHCSSDLREPVVGLCFAASCCSQLPELKKLSEIFTMKYGSNFIASAQEMKATSHVNQLLLDFSCPKGPPENLKEELNRCVLRQSNKKDSMHKELLELLSRNTKANEQRHQTASHHGCEELDKENKVVGERRTTVLSVADGRPNYNTNSLHSSHKNYDVAFKRVSIRPKRRQSFEGSNNRACIPPDYELVVARVAELSGKTQENES